MPTVSPFTLMFKSRKFLLMLFDTIVTLTLFFVGKYALNALEDVKFVIIALQPVVIALIFSIAYEDAAPSRGATVNVNTAPTAETSPSTAPVQ